MRQDDWITQLHLQETLKDYYTDERGRVVFAAHFLRKRGYCCTNGCRHCPYDKEG